MPADRATEWLQRGGMPPAWARLALGLLRTEARGGAATGLRAAHWAEHVWPLRFRQIDSLAYLATSGPRCAAQRLYDKIWAAQRRALAELREAAAAIGIVPTTFKGVAIVERFWGDSALGMLHDIDILLARAELAPARRMLYALGYLHGLFDPATGEWNEADAVGVAETEARHYELYDFSRAQALELDAEELAEARALSSHPTPVRVSGEQAFAIVRIDLHHALSASIGGPDLLVRRVAEGHGGHTLSCTDQLWTTVVRYYTEVALHGSRSLRSLAYIARLMRAPDVDWSQALALARAHDGGPAMRYLLGSIDALADGALLDPDVRAELTRFRPVEPRDWGWQLGRLFDADEPCPVGAWIGGEAGG